jgi:hypothetical protein
MLLGKTDDACSTPAQAEVPAVPAAKSRPCHALGCPRGRHLAEDVPVYLNYNGAGGAVTGDTVRHHHERDQVGAYAVRNGSTSTCCSSTRTPARLSPSQGLTEQLPRYMHLACLRRVRWFPAPACST